MQKINFSKTYAGMMSIMVGVIIALQNNTFAADYNPAEDSESKLIAVLQSDAQPQDKAIACKKLAICGTKAAVPALAVLLSDEKLASWARIGLESIPNRAVDEALRNAMDKLQGKLLIGVINSISRRGDTKAVKSIIQKTKDTDVEVASAAIEALGCIGGNKAIETLEQMLGNATQVTLPVVCGACLRCADSLVIRNKHSKAAKLCELVLNTQAPRYIRMEAMRNLIIARQDSGISLLIEQLKGNDAGMTAVAMGLAHTMPGEKLTGALVSEVGKLPPEKQVYVIDALGCRLDKSIAPALFGLTKSSSTNVCIAAINALSKLGDASALPLLVDIAVSGESEITMAAQSGIVAFRSAEADAASVGLLTSRDAASRVVGADIINRRGMATAMPAVLKVAMNDPDENVRVACINVLRELGRLENLQLMVEILVKNRSSAEAQAVEKAMATICGRQTDMTVCADSLITGISRAQPAQKCTLLRILRSVGGPKSLQAIRAAMSDSNAEVKDTATRLICDWNTVEAAPDLLALAKNSPNATYKILALRGYIRVSGDKNVTAVQRLAMCKEASVMVQRDEEKKILLGALANCTDAESFAMAAAHLDTAALKDEACLATVAIAENIVKDKPDAVRSVMEKVVSTSKDKKLIARARSVMAKAKK
ncbi:MAG: HEAT repeat domain-containing protein [Kiritimatiellae bacterium]|nr:HEAT repeat domain-containing protein [Kiritimatiellia bacterium]